jgi:minor extracellular serine protease Vpr
MTRRRRLRTRTLLLALAAALAGAVVLPALGAPDQVQQALRSWDPVIGDGRGGEPLPVQVIVVLAAPPAVTIDSPDASKVATATQQLDLDALTRAGIVLGVQYRYVNALNAVSATVRRDQLAQLQAAPEVAGVYPVRMVYPAETVARHLAKLGAAARPLAGARAGRGVTVALLDGPVDRSHPYLHDPAPGWNAIDGKPQDASPGPLASAHATAMAGIVTGRDGPAGLHGVAPDATLESIQVLELQHGDLMGTTATLLAGIDRALDPNGDGNLSDRADVILAPVAEPFAAFGASAETVAAQGAERAGAVLVAAAGNDGPTGGRFGTVASPAASPDWLAVGASDGRPSLPSVNVTLTTDGAGVELDTMPLAGALTPVGGATLPLVLPAGPTESDPARAPADVAAGTEEGDYIVDGTSLVKGKAVLLPRDGAMISRRAAAASAAGAKALVLYGDGGAPAGALGLDDQVTIPIAVIPGAQGAAAAGTLLTGGAVTVTFGSAHDDANPENGSVAPFSSTGLAFDDSVKPDLVAPGVAVTSSAPGGHYAAQSGTSVAAAQVAGAAALLLQAHSDWAPRVVRGALVGTARPVGEGDGPAPVEAQGGGTVDIAAATAATVVAEPASLAFGLARAPDVTVKRVLTLANTGKATEHVSLSLARDGGGDGAKVTLDGARSDLAIAPGATLPVPLTLTASGLPASTSVIGGWVLVATGHGTLRVPWALSHSDSLAAGLIGRAALVPPLVQPTTNGDPASKLVLVLGSAGSTGEARLEIAPVQRLSVDLYRDSHLLGRLVDRHELLPGSYRYALTGIDPSTGKALTPGVYKLVIDAVSSDEVTSERQLGFTVSG